ncbi:MAG: tetratricopeptide repeat protein [Deltaproteobacteria bacterium]|nr:tetratricopeptide repeat protein [Deltaproteobacteria bacterium]
MRHPYLPILIAFGALFVAGSAFAAPVVLHGPNDDAVSAATVAKDVLGSGDFQVAGDLTKAIGPVGSVVALGAELTPCAKAKIPSVEGVIAESTAWVDQMEYGEAIKSVDRIASLLPCAGGEASRGELFQVWFLRGIAAFNDGDEDSARDAFGRAATIDPSRKWDDAFPPTPKELYLEALQDALSRPPVALEVVAEGVRIDGVDLVAGQGATSLVGEHVLTHGGAVYGFVVPAGADKVILSTPAALARGVLAGDDAGATWLSLASAENGWQEVLVVDGEVARRFADGDWIASEFGSSKAVAGAPPPLLIAGIGTAGAGLGLMIGGIAANSDARGKAFDPDGNPLIDNEERYVEVRAQSQAGTALAVAGAVTLVAGAGLTIVSLVAGPPKMAVVPTFGASPAGVSFGLSGRF